MKLIFNSYSAEDFDSVCAYRNILNIVMRYITNYQHKTARKWTFVCKTFCTSQSSVTIKLSLLFLKKRRVSKLWTARCQEHLNCVSQLSMSHLPFAQNLHILPSGSINNVIINHRKHIMQWSPACWNERISDYSATYYSGGCEQCETSARRCNTLFLWAQKQESTFPLLGDGVWLQTVGEKGKAAIHVWSSLWMSWHAVTQSITRWCCYSCSSINNGFITFYKC